MKIRRHIAKGTNVIILEAIQCGKVVASGKSRSELREKLRLLGKLLRERSQGRHGTEGTPRQWYQTRRMP